MTTPANEERLRAIRAAILQSQLKSNVLKMRIQGALSEFSAYSLQGDGPTITRTRDTIHTLMDADLDEISTQMLLVKQTMELS